MPQQISQYCVSSQTPQIYHWYHNATLFHVIEQLKWKTFSHEMPISLELHCMSLEDEFTWDSHEKYSLIKMFWTSEDQRKMFNRSNRSKTNALWVPWTVKLVQWFEHIFIFQNTIGFGHKFVNFKTGNNSIQARSIQVEKTVPCGIHLRWVVHECHTSHCCLCIQ